MGKPDPEPAPDASKNRELLIAVIPKSPAEIVRHLISRNVAEEAAVSPKNIVRVTPGFVLAALSYPIPDNAQHAVHDLWALAEDQDLGMLKRAVETDRVLKSRPPFIL